MVLLFIRGFHVHMLYTAVETLGKPTTLFYEFLILYTILVGTYLFHIRFCVKILFDRKLNS